MPTMIRNGGTSQNMYICCSDKSIIIYHRKQAMSLIANQYYFFLSKFDGLWCGAYQPWLMLITTCEYFVNPVTRRLLCIPGDKADLFCVHVCVWHLKRLN